MGPRKAEFGGSLALAAGLLALLAGGAAAGPWTQDEGHGQVILQAGPYRSDVNGTDDRGRTTGIGKLYRGDAGAYWEHGVSPRWTVGLAPRLQASWLDDRVNHRTTASQGLAELGGFARYRLYKGDYDVLSIQGGVSTPGIANDSTRLRIAEPHPSLAMSLAYGIGLPLPRGMSAFAAFEAGYRYRPGTAADELRLDASIGFRPIPRWMLIAQSFSTLGMRNNGPNGADYAVNKVQFSVVHELTERHSIAVGYMREIDGRRVALGQAVFGSLWYRY